jgi:cation-transporting ATPase 13A2
VLTPRFVKFYTLSIWRVLVFALFCLATFLGWGLIAYYKFYADYQAAFDEKGRPPKLSNFGLFVAMGVLNMGLWVIVLRSFPRLRALALFAQVGAESPSAEYALVSSLDDVYTMHPVMCLAPVTSVFGEQASAASQALPRWTRWKAGSKQAVAGGERALRFFEWRFERFWWDGAGGWARHCFDLNVPYDNIHAIAARRVGEGLILRHGEGPAYLHRRKITYGLNEIDLRNSPVAELLLEQVVHPFNVFQFFVVGVWFSQPYNIYAGVILCLTFLNIAAATYDRWSSQRSLQRLARETAQVTRVSYDPAEKRLTRETISSTQLLPGDVVEIGVTDQALPFDALLLTGSVVVNEAMLTGESAPILKSAVPLSAGGRSDDSLKLGSSRDSKYTLFAGTKVVQARASSTAPVAVKPLRSGGGHPSSVWQLGVGGDHPPAVLAVVSRTAFGTAKGQLIRAIVFPRPTRFNMNKEVTLFFLLLVLTLAAGVAIYVPSTQGSDPISKSVVVQKILNLLTVIISPALPLSLSIGVNFALTRLFNTGIACINPPRIVAAGRVNMLCFDKTGTLTQESLTLKMTVASRGGGMRGKETLSDAYYSSSSSSNSSSSYSGTGTTTSTSTGTSASGSSSSGGTSSSATSATSATSGTSGTSGSTLDDGGKPLPQMRTLLTEVGVDLALFLGACHGVAELEIPGQTPMLVGDPLEIGMLEGSGWVLCQRPERREDMARAPWNMPGLPPSADTIMLPPDSLRGHRSAGSGTGLAVGEPVAIVRRLEFDSDLRRMSVLAMTLTGSGSPALALLVKGAPESLRPLCGATVPADFDETLERHTNDGMRVLACAYRQLAPRDLGRALEDDRGKLEQSLVFAGFLVMENGLKDATARVLAEHARCGLRQCMITGDHALTAVSVSKKCGPVFVDPGRPTALIDAAPGDDGAVTARVLERPDRRPYPLTLTSDLGGLPEFLGGANLAVTGAAFAALLAEHRQVPEGPARRQTLLAAVAARSNVWARCSPINKREIVEVLSELDYVVCFTGDGANDSAALKAADVGISISAAPMSEAEQRREAAARARGDAEGASAATIAAPFSTKLADIGATTTVLRHGRAAIVANFSVFKFMYIYGIVQFTTAILVYFSNSEIGEWQYIWYDMAIVFAQLWCIPLLQPAPLSVEKPPAALLSASFLRSLFLQFWLVIWPQVGAWKVLKQQPWYVPPVPFEGFNNVPATDDASALFFVSQYLYLFIGIAAGVNYGLFRRHFFTNIPHVVFAAFMWSIMTFFTLGPTSGVGSIFGLNLFDDPQKRDIRWKLFLFGNFGGLSVLLCDRFCVPHTSTEPPTFDVDAYSRAAMASASAADYTNPVGIAQPAKEDWAPTILPTPKVNRGYLVAGEVAETLFGK